MLFFNEKNRYLINEADPFAQTNSAENNNAGTDNQAADSGNGDANLNNPDNQNNDMGENGDSFDLNNDADMGDDGFGGEGDTSGQDYGNAGDEELVLDNTEKSKKIILLSQYKQLVSTLNNLEMTVEDLLSKTDYNNNLYIDFLNKNISTFKERINYVLVEKFVDDDYENLLKMYFYFKYQLVDMVKLLKKLSDIKK